MQLEWTWLRSRLDDPAESKSLAALKLCLNEEVLTRAYDKVAGGQRETINVALYPLALGIAENWWRLLYEPRKSDEDHSAAETCHTLDAWMNGYVFPALALWSGGEDAITAEHPNIRQQHSTLEFLPTAGSVTNLPRNEIEQNLFRLVQSVLERVPLAKAEPLDTAWNRVLESLQNADERRYCEAAGRLGVNPYDPDAEDISKFAEGMSDHLFASICEATIPSEMPLAVEWVRSGARYLSDLPEVDLLGFGAFPERDPQAKIWEHGYEAARMVRRARRVDESNPRRGVDQLFGAAVTLDGIAGAHPFSLEAIANRANGAMRVTLPRKSARQRRFSLCRASYLGWKAHDGESSAVTTAGTLDQQASRAFAAELMAPEHLLRELAKPDGLTPEKIETFAEENVCPEPAVIWQAHNHGIPLRGVALPRSRHL